MYESAWTPSSIDKKKKIKYEIFKRLSSAFCGELTIFCLCPPRMRVDQEWLHFHDTYHEYASTVKSVSVLLRWRSADHYYIRNLGITKLLRQELSSLWSTEEYVDHLSRMKSFSFDASDPLTQTGNHRLTSFGVGIFDSDTSLTDLRTIKKSVSACGASGQITVFYFIFRTIKQLLLC